MAIVSAHKSDVGLRRRHNEDYIWADDEIGLYIVADGMGGQEAGEVASRMAATTVSKLISNQLKNSAQPPSPQAVKELLTQSIQTANTEIFNTGKEKGQKRRMGTTIVVALVQPSVAYISHVGDSRAYLVRNGMLIPLTEDDSWDALLAARGRAKSEDKPGGMSHVLTKAVGHKPEVKPSFRDITLLSGDWLLLCSDGLWNMLEDQQTLNKLKEADSNPDQVVDALVEAANQAGGKDNISVVVVKIV